MAYIQTNLDAQKTTVDNSSNDNTTTKLKSPDDCQRELLKVMKIDANWLQADLKFRYNIPEKISREWLSTQKLVPLLDGLDELGLSRQKKCIDINEFVQSISSLSLLVVCVYSR
ncbi:MAG: hypothetical protein WA959_30245 [Rivularia sp. (in: cyanobacteria)]